MNQAITGAAYVDVMNRDPADREYRRAFLDLATTLVQPRGRVFDFGSGPGIDARHYAHEGLQVDAYDIDTEMCEYFSRHCAVEIAAGSVHLNTAASYAEFLHSQDLPDSAGVDLIVANFAPLNLVADLPPLFEKFAAMLNSDGRLLVSVLNPFFRALLKSRRWWAHLPRLLWHGNYTTRLHGITPVTRWLPRSLARQAAPFFELTSIYAPQVSVAGQAARRVQRFAPRDWPTVAASQFLFLQFRQRTGA